jgi:hypothetical protein
MKKLLFLLLLASPLMADGPKYKYSDPHLDDEITNIYHDLKYQKGVIVTNSTGTFTLVKTSTITVGLAIISSGSATSFNIAHSTITNLTVTGATQGIKGRVIQSSASLVSSFFSTTSGTPVQTNLFITLTCASTANLVKITAWGVLEDTDANASNENVYLYVDNTQLAFTTILTTSGANQIRIPWSITFLHAPASTSAKVYNIRIASVGGNTVRLGVNAGGEHQYMLVEEIQQ